MLGLLLSIIAVTSVPSTDVTRIYGRDIVVRASDNLTVVDDSGNYYEFDITYDFHTHLYFNNENDFAYYFSGVNVELQVFNSSETLLFTTSDSWYLEVDDTLTPYDNYSLLYGFYDDDYYYFNINLDYQSGTQYMSMPLEYNFTAPLNIMFSETSNAHWSNVVMNDIPMIINAESYNIGYNEGYTLGLQQGDTQGYQRGYSEGYTNAQADDSVPAIIFGGVLNIAMIPVNFFLAILNFEVFGINIGGFVTGLMTIAVIIILFGVIFGGRPAPHGGPSGGGKNG